MYSPFPGAVAKLGGGAATAVIAEAGVTGGAMVMCQGAATLTESESGSGVVTGAGGRAAMLFTSSDTRKYLTEDPFRL